MKWGLNRIGNRWYTYMMVVYELGNLGGTLGLTGDLGYIEGSHFSKPQVFASIRSSLQEIQEQYFVALSV